ncbi:MAG: hypothetical protein ACFWTK_06890 [Clostridium sp.]
MNFNAYDIMQGVLVIVYVNHMLKQTVEKKEE